MSDEPIVGDARQPHATPNLHTCAKCGSTAWPMALLDSRHGVTYRLVRCLNCETMLWTTEKR